jgi:hypothetical protein
MAGRPRKNANEIIQSDLSLSFPLGSCQAKLEFDGLVTESSIEMLQKHLEIVKAALVNGGSEVYNRRKDDDLPAKQEESFVMQ